MGGALDVHSVLPSNCGRVSFLVLSVCSVPGWGWPGWFPLWIFTYSCVFGGKTGTWGVWELRLQSTICVSPLPLIFTVTLASALSARTLCDNLRRERDRAVSELAEALRSLDDTRKQKNDVSRELKELKYVGVGVCLGVWWPLSCQGRAATRAGLADCPFTEPYSVCL